MLYLSHLFCRRTSSTDSKFLINLPGIGIDHWDAEVLGYVDTEAGLADGCGACDNDERFLQLPDDSTF